MFKRKNGSNECSARVRGCGVAVVLLGLMLSGCMNGGAKYWVLVENKGAASLSEIRLTVDGTNHYESATIPSGITRGFKPELDRVPAAMQLVWKDGASVDHRYSLAKDALPQGFEGYLYFLVSEDQSVRIFKKAIRASRAEGPWVRPAEWEGSLTVPGMGQ